MERGVPARSPRMNCLKRRRRTRRSGNRVLYNADGFSHGAGPSASRSSDHRTCHLGEIARLTGWINHRRGW